MDKFLIKRPRSEKSFNSPKAQSGSDSSEKNNCANFNSYDNVSDPGLRKPTEDFHLMIEIKLEGNI
ncbi:hypothetical protein DsansV1_C20g0164951 [Dioscorea sansibarensis]